MQYNEIFSIHLLILARCSCSPSVRFFSSEPPILDRLSSIIAWLSYVCPNKWFRLKLKNL